MEEYKNVKIYYFFNISVLNRDSKGKISAILFSLLILIPTIP